jgi:mRNA-degrading endonuclease RelE of RelBE toxin-antitoxin system
MSYRIEYSPSTIDHFKPLTAGHRSLVIDTVEKQLRYEPLKQTRNRKPMRLNLLAPWELRIRDLRVYYDVEEQPEPRVLILAIGIKDRNRLLIGEKEIQL